MSHFAIYDDQRLSGGTVYEFQYEQDAAAADVGGRKRKPRLIEIDGEYFEINTAEQAEQFLELARETAKTTAAAAAAKAAAKAERAKTEAARARALFMAQPKISSSEPDDGQLQAQIDATRAQIAETYAKALRDAVAARVEAARQDEETVMKLIDDSDAEDAALVKQAMATVRKLMKGLNERS